MKKTIIAAMAGAGVLLMTACGPDSDINVKKVADKNCMTGAEDVKLTKNRYIAGLKGMSNKAKTMRLKIRKKTELVAFNDQTKVEGVSRIYDLKKKDCIVVDFKKEGDDKIATRVRKLPSILEKVEKYLVQTPYLEKKINQIPPKEQGYRLIDSRPGRVYIKGTIPGAESIFFAKLQKADDITKLLGKDKDQELIFFCGGKHCNLAPGSALLAAKAGYKNIKLYHQGFPTWKKTGHVVCKSAKGFKKQKGKKVSMITIDTRKAETAKKEHIPGAVNITADQLKSWKGKFPKISSSEPWNKMAPIVLYNNSDSCHKGDKTKLADMAKTIISWGYRNVNILNGGLAGYKKAGGKTAKDSFKATIKYERKLLPGQISTKDFVQSFKSLGSDEVLIDARPSNEYDAAHLPGAINMPADKISKADMSKLKDYKKAYIYCNSGVLAQIAYEKLQKHGFKNAKFLKANVKYKGGKAELGNYKKYKIDLPKDATSGKKNMKIEGC